MDRLRDCDKLQQTADTPNKDPIQIVRTFELKLFLPYNSTPTQTTNREGA